MVVGDENGHVGAGTGKAAEIPDAVRKAIDSAKKNMINVPMVGTTIAHEIIGEYGAGRVLLKPAGRRYRSYRRRRRQSRIGACRYP